MRVAPATCCSRGRLPGPGRVAWDGCRSRASGFGQRGLRRTPSIAPRTLGGKVLFLAPRAGAQMTSLFVHRRLERLLAERAALGTPLDDHCAQLLERLRKECPEAVPPPKPKPGGLSDPVMVKTEQFQHLVRSALEAEDGEGPVLLIDG